MITVKPQNQQKHFVQIIQITDTHIFADSQSTFDGIFPEETLQQVLELAQKSEYWPPDLILATGDLVHDPVRESYEKFCDLLNKLDVPVFCLPGNHDDPESMPMFLNVENVSTEKEIHCGDWVVLMLNSFIANTHSGELSAEELAWLSGKLLEHEDKLILIALHHHPVSIQSSWLDSMMLRNADDFLETIENRNQVKLVIWGHIHQEFLSETKATKLLGSPSTCVQFLPGATQYATDDKSPGLRQIQLYPDGQLTTSVIRIDAK